MKVRQKIGCHRIRLFCPTATKKWHLRCCSKKTNFHFVTNSLYRLFDWSKQRPAFSRNVIDRRKLHENTLQYRTDISTFAMGRVVLLRIQTRRAFVRLCSIRDRDSTIENDKVYIYLKKRWSNVFTSFTVLKVTFQSNSRNLHSYWNSNAVSKLLLIGSRSYNY